MTKLEAIRSAFDALDRARGKVAAAGLLLAVQGMKQHEAVEMLRAAHSTLGRSIESLKSERDAELLRCSGLSPTAPVSST